jgi:hypothetical protein
MIFWAVMGAFIGLTVYLVTYTLKNQRFTKLMKSVKEHVDYAGLYHFASFKRYKKAMKFFDSYGLLYLIGNTAYYKTVEGVQPLSFDLRECSVQLEQDWRSLKWFSITTPAGEKYYFDSHKMGAFKNNSDETIKGFEKLKSRSTA